MIKIFKNRFKKNLITKGVALSRKHKMLFAISLDILLCVFASWLSLSLRLGKIITIDERLIYASLVSVGVAIPIFFSWGVYRMIFRYLNADSFQVLSKGIILYTLIYYVIFGIANLQNIPRSIGLMQPMILFLLISISRWWIKKLLSQHIDYAQLKSTSIKKKDVIIFGAGKFGQQLASSLKHNNEFKLLFFVDNNQNLWGGTIDGYPVKPPSSLKKFINPVEVKQLWFTNPEISKNERSNFINSISGLPYHVKILPTFSDLTDGKVYLKDLRELDFNDLLERDDIKPNDILLKKCISKKTVLVTGAGGSIGSEICLQILNNNPSCIVLVEISEVALYHIHSKLLTLIKRKTINLNNNMIIVPLLVNVLNEKKLDYIFEKWRPDTVYHVAAYKHVPIVEHNVAAGITNNVIGTMKCAQISIKYNVKNFVLVSTDKAVRPTNIMGASKRLAEISVQTLNDNLINKETKLCMVRFGNVLGSSGSVAPLFQKQIESGGPITLTHIDVTRYFMTITEAAQLVIQAGALSRGGEVFVLDMGEPIKIIDLAYKMIKAKGLQVRDEKSPWGDIEIQVDGLRPGEKLYEELLIGDNPKNTTHPRILRANEKFISKDDFTKIIKKLHVYLDENNIEEIRKLLKQSIPGYVPNKENVDWLSNKKNTS